MFVHNLISKAICSECTDFCLQLCFLEKEKENTLKYFPILNMKAHFEKDHILKMKTGFWKSEK